MKIRLFILFFLISLCSKSQELFKISVQTDRPFYLIGQNIRLNFILLDANNQLVPSNELVYFQLRNNANEKLILHKVFANKGKGSISIELPSELKSAYYYLLVYTNYLLNHGEDAVRKLQIPVYNPSDKYNEAEGSALEGPIEVAVEGGQLIDNLTTRIYFRVSDECESTFLLQNEGGKTLGTTKTEHGLGAFVLKPKRHEQYKITGNCNEQSVSYPLQKVASEGVSLRIDEKENYFALIVRSTRSYYGREMTLKGFYKQTLIYHSTGTLSKHGLITKVEKSNLPKQLLSFHILDKEGQVLSTRSVFNQQESLINVKVDTSLQTRNQINLDVKLPTDLTYLSAHIYPSPWIGQYNSNTQPTYGSAVFFEPDKVPKTKSNKTYKREEYLFLRGRLKDENPLPDSADIYFFIPGVNTIYKVNVGNTGRFELPLLFDFYGEQNIPYFVYAKTHEFINPKLELIDPHPSPSKIPFSDLKWSEPIQKEIMEVSLYEKLMAYQKFYNNPPDQMKRVSEEFRIDAILSEPDAEYLLDEYKSFESMDVVIKEIINGLLLRTRKGEKTLRLFAEDLLTIYQDTPLIFINNVPTKDVNNLLSLDPDNVKRIQLYNRHEKIRQLGPFGDGGLVIVDLKKDYTHKSDIQTTRAVGLTKEIEHKRVNNPEMPDTRRVLLNKYFYNLGKGNVSIPFKTSDRPGNYQLRLYYIDKMGNEGTFEKELVIQFNPDS